MSVEKLEFATRLPLSSWSGVGTLTAALVAAGDDSAARQAALDTIPEEYKWTEADVNRLGVVVDANADELTGALNSISGIVGATVGVTLETLKAETNALNLLLTSSDPTLDTVQERVDRINQIISDAESLAIADVAGLDTALAGKEPAGVAQSLVDAVQATVNTQIATLQGLIDSINLTLSTDNTAFDTAQERLNELIRLSNLLNGLAISNISGLQMALDGLASSITSIESRLDDLEAPPSAIAENTTAAAISGVGYTGQTLTAVAGTWTGGTPTGQWFADGLAISGETALSYVVSADNNGAAFTYVESVGDVTQLSNEIHNWTPDDISTTLWLDAADSSTLTVEIGSNKISQWDDKSGNGNHVIQVVQSDQPEYSDNALSTGIPGLVWGDSENNKHLSFSGISQPVGTVAMVAQFGNGVESSPQNAGLYTSLFGFSNNADGIGLLIYIPTTNWYDVDGEFETHSRNGVMQSTTGSALPMPKSSLVALRSAIENHDQIVIGRDRASINRGWLGFIGEVIILPVVADANQRALIEGYMAWKSDTTLPSGHVYKHSPPAIGA